MNSLFSRIFRFAHILLLALIATCGAVEAKELPADIHQRVTLLSKQGDNLAASSKYREAIASYMAALELVPAPREDWNASTWLLVAIGDAYFLSQSYEPARKALLDAMHCPGAIGNSFIHLRLGQVQYELGNKERAADELARAYMGAGKDIFSSEDPKYFAFLKTRLKPPSSGTW